MSELKSNVFKTAILFEGGSLRGAYTAGVVRYFLDHALYFDHVYGVSSGSSNTVNYLSRDPYRVVESFGSLMAEPQAGSLKTFLQGKGMFNAPYLYQEAGLPGGRLPFDFETFSANPASCTIFSIDAASGQDLYFTKEDMPTLESLMLQVRASSTLPFFMPAPVVNGLTCYDGGFARGGGLPLEKILEDGFERIVVIRTRPRGYRKGKTDAYMRLLFPSKPQMHRAVLTRNARYNASCDLLDRLEESGKAYVFYPEELTLEGTERDVEALYANICSGYKQMDREFSYLMNFVEAGE